MAENSKANTGWGAQLVARCCGGRGARVTGALQYLSITLVSNKMTKGREIDGSRKNQSESECESRASLMSLSGV